MNLAKSIGLYTDTAPTPEGRLLQYINLKLAAMGLPTVVTEAGDSELHDMAASLLSHHRESERLLANYLCAADWRIQQFLDDYLYDTSVQVKLPSQTFVLDRHGLARTLSLPVDKDEFVSDIVSSYRTKQGVLHNPKSDRRTTKGVFHVADGGLPVPADKYEVPKITFALMLKKALQPPASLMRLPITSEQEKKAECYVTLLLRPLLCPEVKGFTPEKRMEVRFFVPGNLVSNLDFVESIFGNAGDPYLPENDAGLDTEHWSGHTGCVILAPHLIGSTKKELGLPHYDKATARQRLDGMCWKTEDELYNDGQAYKLTARDSRGVVVTIIADNYFGYCKKEVKTQLSYAANLFGLCEEEHAGGAMVYPAYDLGEEFSGNLHVKRKEHNWQEVVEKYADIMHLMPEGYGIDKKYADIIYVCEDVHFDLHKQKVSWPYAGKTQSIKLMPGKTYVRPSGYKVHMEKPPGGRTWRLIGTVAEGVLCHKPCTVSGGGKSEISKPITDAIIQGPVFVADFKADFDKVVELIQRDYSDRLKDKSKADNRPILSPERSLGSVIKLLSPASRDYTEEYNKWVGAIPQYIKELVFVVKRYYKPEWGNDWRSHFSVDIINGTPGNELKCDGRKLITNYLRVGYDQDGAWRTFGLRKDFQPASKIQMEDDITASIVVPADAVANLSGLETNPSVKFVQNCEFRLFQRPDDAIHRGYDKQTELDFARHDNFFSNYEPLTTAFANELLEDAIGFDKFTPPIQNIIQHAAVMLKPDYFVSSAHPRIVEGKPSKNPRYLQTRPDLLNPRSVYLAEVATRLQRRIPLGEPVPTPVNAVLPGRRNNPPEPAAKIRPLAVFSPIHYLELPELFMEFISSMTGKSPSTTGAGSEGALTKAPFNALPPIVDLNNALVSYLLTGYESFITSAGYVGPNVRVDHDISLLIPEVWCRMTEQERDPQFLIRNNYLEKCEDTEYEGRKLLSSRLGYRITKRFVRTYFGRVFNHPTMVISEDMLRPELQGMDIFADGMDNIVATHKRVAQYYFDDGSIKDACPPLKALLHIMLNDEFEGKDLTSPEIRALFTREALLSSDWYKVRLATKQEKDGRLWRRHVDYLSKFLNKPGHVEEAKRLGIEQRLDLALAMQKHVKSPEYLAQLNGTLGADPSV